MPNRLVRMNILDELNRRQIETSIYNRSTQANKCGYFSVYDRFETQRDINQLCSVSPVSNKKMK